MCTSCITAAEAVAINLTAGLAVAKGLAERVGDQLAGRRAVERRQAVWDDAASFVRQLGLDADGVLGARPAAPAHEPPASWAPAGAIA